MIVNIENSPKLSQQKHSIKMPSLVFNRNHNGQIGYDPLVIEFKNSRETIKGIVELIERKFVQIEVVERHEGSIVVSKFNIRARIETVHFGDDHIDPSVTFSVIDFEIL